MATTAKYALRYPILANPADVPADIGNLANDADAAFSGYAINTIALRPAAGKAGRIYFATDQGISYFDDGATWHRIDIQAVGATIAIINAFFPGTPPDGSRARLIVGNPPDFVDLVRDEVQLHKWVSVQEWRTSRTSLQSAANYNSPQITDPGTLIKNYYALYQAGLRPQCFVEALLTPAATHSADMRVSAYAVNPGNAAFGAALFHGPNITAVATQFQVSDWGDAVIDNAPTAPAPHAFVFLQYQSSSGVAQYDFSNGSVRLVAA